MEEELFFNQSLIIDALMYGLIFLILVTSSLFLFFHFARKKIVEKELEKATIKLNGQKKVLQATIETQERERKRIAQDLHDAISAKLNVVSLHVNMLLDGSLNSNEQQEALSKVLGVTTVVLDSSRQIAHNLLPPILEKFGLVAALEELFDQFGATKKLTVQHKINYLVSLTKNQELHLFRIVQELLNNSIRHGKASKVSFSLEEVKGHITMLYTDNGKGFLVKQALLESGLGLKNIKSRVAILNGNLDVKSQLGKGVIFTITLKHNSYE